MVNQDTPTTTTTTSSTTTTTTTPSDVHSVWVETGISYRKLNFQEIDMMKTKKLLMLIDEERSAADSHPLPHPTRIPKLMFLDEFGGVLSENDMRNFFSRDLGASSSETCSATSEERIANEHHVNIPPSDGVCHGTNSDQRQLPTALLASVSRIMSDLKQSLTTIAEKEIIKIMIYVGKKVDNQIGMGIIAVALADLATTESATRVSWFDKNKPVLYALLCAFQVSAVVLRPSSNITHHSIAASSPAPVNKVDAEKLGDLMAGGTLFCAAISLFCRCLAGIPLGYAVTSVSVCTSLVLSCAVFGFYSNPS